MLKDEHNIYYNISHTYFIYSIHLQIQPNLAKELEGSKLDVQRIKKVAYDAKIDEHNIYYIYPICSTFTMYLIFHRLHISITCIPYICRSSQTWLKS